MYTTYMENLLWGLWNGITAWPLLITHLFGLFTIYPVYDVARDSWWYQLGFLIGSGSPLLGLLGRGR